jgi:hypothetical protein
MMTAALHKLQLSIIVGKVTGFAGDGSILNARNFFAAFVGRLPLFRGWKKAFRLALQLR